MEYKALSNKLNGMPILPYTCVLTTVHVPVVPATGYLIVAIGPNYKTVLRVKGRFIGMSTFVHKYVKTLPPNLNIVSKTYIVLVTRILNTEFGTF